MYILIELMTAVYFFNNDQYDSEPVQRKQSDDTANKN